MRPLPAFLALRNTRLGPKLALATLLLIAAAVYAIVVVYQFATERIDYSRQERLGLELHTGLRALQQHLQRHRGSSVAVALKIDGSETAAAAARAGTDDAAARVDAAYARQGDRFGGLARWRAIRDGWEQLKSDSATHPPSDMQAAHTTLIVAVLDLMESVVVHSSLMLDPEPDTYYLVASIAEEPRATAQLGELRSLGLLVMAGRGGRSTFERMRRQEVLARERVESTRRLLGIAIKSNPDIDVLLGDAPSHEKAASDALLAAAVRVLESAGAATMEPRRYFVTGDAASAARYALYDAAARALDQRLEHRIGVLVGKRRATLAGVTLALLVSCGLLVVILHDLNDRLRTAARSAEKLAAGVLEGVPANAGADEVGNLLESMSRAASQLRTFVEAELEMAHEQALGHVRYRIDVARYPGIYGNIADKLNRLIEAHSTEQDQVMQAIADYASGDLSRDPPEFPGDKAEVTRTLREVRQLLAIIHNSPVPHAILDLESRRYLQVNAAWTEYTGYSSAEVIGRDSVDVGLLDREAFDALAARRIAMGGLAGNEIAIRHRNGSTRYALLWSRGIREKAFSLVVTWLIDITERKRAAIALGASEQRFAALFAESPAPLTLISLASRRHMDVNRAWSELSGFSREEAIGRTASELGTVRDTGLLPGIVQALHERGCVDRIEMMYWRRGSDPRTCLASARMVSIDGEAAVIWGFMDVTDQYAAQRQVEALNTTLESTVEKRTAELTRANSDLNGALESLKSSQEVLLQSEKLAALGRLVAGIAHELNTPIGNSLLSATTLAERTEDFARDAGAGELRRSTLESYVSHAREAAQILFGNLDKAAHLIQSFKQVAADQTSSQRRAFALKEVVEEVLLAHHPMLKRSPITVATDVPGTIRLDSYPGPLGQVLGNLITNAVLHAYEGRPRGAVTVSARLDGDDSVEIAVRDDGCGISESDLKRVFEPFFTTRMGRGGTGLGLSICHRMITESLGGTIRAASRPGEGTTFILRLPLTAPAATVSREAA